MYVVGTACCLGRRIVIIIMCNKKHEIDKHVHDASLACASQQSTICCR